MDAKQKKVTFLKCIGFFFGITIILIGAGVLAGQMFLEDLTGPTMLFIFAFAFFNLFYWYRKNWWAILPGGLFLSGGTAAALDTLAPDSLMSGPAFLFLLAAAFLFVAIVSSRNWWAILPGGAFLSLSVVVLLENFTSHSEFPAFLNGMKLGIYTWVLLFGLAVTFGVLWMLHKVHPTGWAIYPAAGFLAAAVMALLLGSRFTEFWWVTLFLGAGTILLLSLLVRKKLPQGNH